MLFFYPIKNVYDLFKDIFIEVFGPKPALKCYYCTVYSFIETFLLYKNEK